MSARAQELHNMLKFMKNNLRRGNRCARRDRRLGLSKTMDAIGLDGPA